MPHANIWIKKEDWGKWDQLENKSAFVSDALRGSPKISPPKKIQEHENKINNLTRRLCKNGHILNSLTKRCTQKGCQYS